jgi:hypothetical protein
MMMMVAVKREGGKRKGQGQEPAHHRLAKRFTHAMMAWWRFGFCCVLWGLGCNAHRDSNSNNSSHHRT